MTWVHGSERLPALGELVWIRYDGRTYKATRWPAPKCRRHCVFGQWPHETFLMLAHESFEWRPLDPVAVEDPNPVPPCVCGLPSAASARQAPPYLCTRCEVREAALRTGARISDSGPEHVDPRC